MQVDMSVRELILVNVAAWLLLHLVVAWLGTRLPVRFFCPGDWIYRARGWEREGGLYERVFFVRAWKDRLPDGAAIFTGGFSKARLKGASPERIERFVRETCRGEAVHWVVLFAAFLFFAWNPWWAGCVMIVYGVAANMPCIIVQRYNRLRLARLQSARRASGNACRRGCCIVTIDND